jgi:ketosteroid isomerase-like protein
MTIRWLALIAVALLAACAAAPPAQRIDAATMARLEQEVADTERGLARTMAARDHAAFASFVAEDASFRSPDGVLVGKAAVVEHWARFYQSPQAPFSWEPDLVTVQSDGRLAISTGPVHDARGKRIARFISVWRREADGSWKVILDAGVSAGR